MKTRIHGQAGQSLLDTIRTTEHPQRAPCAGRGTCGKCRVIVSPHQDSPLAAAEALELRHLSSSEQSRGVRLACLTRFAREGWVELEQGDDGIAIPTEQLSVTFDQAICEAARVSGRPLRVAVDIGTTTLAVCLVDAAEGKVLSVRTAANAQKSWGSDVVARIQAVIDDKAALEALHRVVVKQIEALVNDQLSAAGRVAAELDRVVVAGNTVMLHLFTGADPSGMACVPFRPIFLDTKTFLAADLGFAFPSPCQVSVLPGISAFVGADISAGVLATGLHLAEKTELLLDIGTNGEMVLGNSHGLVSTATAAGPAFEGAQITHGCPGVPGALDHAGWADQGFWYTTIGDQPLTGICGSGLLDLAAVLRRGGQLDETGYLELPEDQEEFFPDPAHAVSLSQGDIRQLQLAKGAIAAGLEILCLKAGVTIATIDTVHLAGGFGTFLRPSSALAIGLLPQGLRGKVVPAGNTALKGALAVLAHEEALTQIQTIASQTRAVDLSTEAAFQMAFAEAMMFPEEPGDDSD